MTITAARRPASESARPTALRQLPGLDGLRAIAVVAVIVYHLDTSWLPGGYLGVDLFFVISGYLITALLLSEEARTGGIRLSRFWLRRARRLLPALGILLFVVVVLAALFGRDALGRLQLDLPASIFYLMNWRLVFEHDTYTASFGRPPLLQHLWSLSVEEQFYLIWPPVLLLMRRHFTRERIALIALGGALVSAVLMGLLYQSGNPSPVYFATDTHAFGLLIGCALAASIPPWHMTAAVAPEARRILERSGAVALFVVAIGLIVLGFDSAVTYRGGVVFVDLAAAVVIATVAHPASRLGEALARQPLRWIGLRSYSLYLWHWPIFVLLRPGADLSWSSGPVDIIRLALTAAAAEASYRYIEQPWRQGRAFPALKERLAAMTTGRRFAVMAAPLVLVAALLSTAPSSNVPTILTEGSTAAARGLPAAPQSTTTIPSPVQPGLLPISATVRPIRSVHPSPTHTTVTTRPPAAPGPVPASAEPILAIGDSVLLAASPELQQVFGPSITIDAAVGRQVNAGVTRIEQYKSSGTLKQYRTVVVDLGTNGRFTSTEFQQMTTALAGVPHVVFYDVHAPRSWAAPDNTVIATGVAANRGQMTMADWNSAAFAPGLLYADGVHPDPAGATVYTHLLQQALAH
ncbi:MAG TPA: acyltransferase family protein [Acidimicrobiales bacterium]|nr:acyltransferase family protein [Acidimicrobiales bacterium]